VLSQISKSRSGAPNMVRKGREVELGPSVMWDQAALVDMGCG